jgi:peroxiredoxin
MSCVWDTERGFGERSWRYSAVIADSKVEKLFVEVSLTNFSEKYCDIKIEINLGWICGSKLWSRSI